MEKVITDDVRWEAPKNGFVKINWDSAVDNSKRNMGIGVIVRDGKGVVLVTLVALKDYNVEAGIAEAATVTPHPNDTQYCSLLASPNQTSQEVTHPSTTFAETRLTAEF